jgi:hypothetical protein
VSWHQQIHGDAFTPLTFPLFAAVPLRDCAIVCKFTGRIKRREERRKGQKDKKEKEKVKN